MNNLVIGNGEVGRAIQKVFNCSAIDKNDPIEKADIIHICFGYFDGFVDEVKRYQKETEAKYTIIHSTVPVGTSRKCNAVHSPIRGIHPELYESTMTFEKFLGGEQASELADVFRRAGVKVILCDTPEETELGKLMSTEYYRACIEHCKRVKNLCDKHNVPFHTAYTLFNKTYNEGYVKMGRDEYVRPTLQPIMTEIKGHCVMPNKKILEDAGDK